MRYEIEEIYLAWTVTYQLKPDEDHCGVSYLPQLAINMIYSFGGLLFQYLRPQYYAFFLSCVHVAVDR